MKEYKLPFFDERPKAMIDTIIIHCSAFKASDAVKTFENAEVSAHYIIDLDGKIIRLADEDKRAWHAGKSFWKGRESLNNYSVGIEVCHLDLGQSPYGQKQLYSLLKLCKRLMKKYHIKPENILGHSDVAPERKADPGKGFPWVYLARHGIGRWYNLRDCVKVKENNPQKLLAVIGYDVRCYEAAAWAFCRHYLPSVVPVDKDIQHLINHPYSETFAVKGEIFLDALKAVAYKHFK